MPKVYTALDICSDFVHLRTHKVHRIALRNWDALQIALRAALIDKPVKAALESL